ncbi:MAG: DNA-processing protein DprA [Alphaproteobacteria bacterium]|nr:DNA-processing protein DprA [Alphaproteobacteria bacterium]
MQTISAEELLGPLNEFEAKHAPDALYVRGDTGILRQGARVSIVGSRKATAFGLARARKLAALLAERRIVVISGLAEGIDTAAHTSAMEHGGRTVAVIGTPIDQAYPKQNRELQERIAREHLLVSQFAPGRPVQRKNFPLRNRTMALISDATVIIEASDSSGSLSQGWEALRLGRALFITKALTENKGISWTREMLDHGARVLSDETLQDFLDILPERSETELDVALPF